MLSERLKTTTCETVRQIRHQFYMYGLLSIVRGSCDLRVERIEQNIYRIFSRNLRTFFSILAAEKSWCVKYADFFVCEGLDLGFILV